ncbi:MAG: S1 family peptidase [Pyrinomonadaceae bacterium]
MQLPTSAQVTTDIAGQAANAVRLGVLRVVCLSTNSSGTGFLHKSGKIVTAAHVIKGCRLQDLHLLTSGGEQFPVSHAESDDALDLTLLDPARPVSGTALSIAPVAPPQIGMQVATWGYPGGYSGLEPLLSVGYLAGTQDFRMSSGQIVRRWVVNAAFNGGNSGGPVLSLENGTIIGVVSSKLSPLPKELQTILDVLKNQKFGMQYQGSRPDGTNFAYSEAQLVAEVLDYLRTQVQLVIGYSVSLDDIVLFLKSRNVDP